MDEFYDTYFDETIIIEKMNKIYIIEDNEVYSLILQNALYTRIQNFEISIYKLAESVETLLENCEIPKVIIVDYYLDVGYNDNINGVEFINKYKTIFPEITFILHSSYDLPESDNYIYIKKETQSIIKIIDILLSSQK